MRYFTTIPLIFSAAFILGACAGDPNLEGKSTKIASAGGRQEVKLRLAHATEDSGDAANAEKLYLQALAQAPNTVSAHMELAEFYRRHHEEQKAIDSLLNALKLERNNTDTARELANTYISIGQPEKALPVLEKASAIHPQDALLYNSRGVAFDQMGNYREAQRAYTTAFDLDPVGGTTYKINMSMSYILSGSYNKAIMLLRPMLNAPESPPIVRQNLALAYGMNGDSEAAQKLGLQDLSDSEVQENIRFYQMLAHKHHTAPYKSTDTSPVQASVVKELFPEGDSDALSTPASGTSSVSAPAKNTANDAPHKVSVSVSNMSENEHQDMVTDEKRAISKVRVIRPDVDASNNAAQIINVKTDMPGTNSLPEPVLRPAN